MNNVEPAGSAESPDVGLVAVGRIGKAHGIRGQVFVEPWTDAPDERFVNGAQLHTDRADPANLIVEQSRDHSGKLVVQFAGIESRNAAEALRGAVLSMAASDRPVIEDPDEFYDSDLVGLRAETIEGELIGAVIDVLHSSGGSVLAIQADEREVLVPFRKELVPVVDLEAGVMKIDPPEGLLEL